MKMNLEEFCKKTGNMNGKQVSELPMEHILGSLEEFVSRYNEIMTNHSGITKEDVDFINYMRLRVMQWERAMRIKYEETDYMKRTRKHKRKEIERRMRALDIPQILIPRDDEVARAVVRVANNKEWLEMIEKEDWDSFKRLAEQVKIIKNDVQWETPFLPVIRDIPDPDDEVGIGFDGREAACLKAEKVGYMLFRCNIYDIIGNGYEPPETVAKKVYDSAEAVVADGWKVD